MAITNSYLLGVYETVKKRNPGESEFLQAVYEVLESLQPVAERRQDLIDAEVFDRIVSWTFEEVDKKLKSIMVHI